MSDIEAQVSGSSSTNSMFVSTIAILLSCHGLKLSAQHERTAGRRLQRRLDPDWVKVDRLVTGVSSTPAGPPLARRALYFLARIFSWLARIFTWLASSLSSLA